MDAILSQLDDALEKGVINSKLYQLLRDFYKNYKETPAYLLQSQKSKIYLKLF